MYIKGQCGCFEGGGVSDGVEKGRKKKPSLSGVGTRLVQLDS